ncbi:ATP-binding protein [Psychromonas sp. 14N.309.X.WAT.B.A12]|uniref:sensor histidine kinase n=2 Tax=unclassified Psychromonas TaxID=2614957 RepID=UPI0025AF9AA6|nr:ATP-binding protein [Psychromonas sp. 14N.309.X.WAT.B.A12]MDN2662240.1 ATP-binding protein [Psychromonas sp. 14N.309.X.WAT.B.A12]
MTLNTMPLGRRINTLCFIFYCMTLVISLHTLWQTSYQSLQISNQQQLERFKRHLDSQLGHYSFIPQLVSRQDVIFKAFQFPDNQSVIDSTNKHLESINHIVSASDTYLLDKSGTTIAASNWQKETTFIGNNFNFRPYFNEAIQGRQAQYFALGSRSGKRGYYFSYPVHNGIQVIGVIVVKMDLSLIEKDWVGKEQHFLVTDNDGIVFISSREDWLFHSLTPLTQQQRSMIKQEKRYLQRIIKSLPPIYGDLKKQANILTLANKKAFSNYYLSLFTVSEDKQWTVRVFAPIAPIIIDLLILTLIITLVYLLIYLSLIIIKQQLHRHQEQARIEAKTKQTLEMTVLERTSALQAEIEERHKAESALRSTQKELIQSAKLAVLGQLSTSISHELNNPLSAIRSYADNAIIFLQRDKLENVHENLMRITSLTERMAKISAQLKSFARKSDGELQIVALQPIILAAQELLKAQFKNKQVQLVLDMPTHFIHVKADAIQLEQILINLLSNALQSMQNTQQNQIKVRLTNTKHKATISVLDEGTGIDINHLPRLFEPFFTTKETGLGLGLSISQQIINNMQGKLTARNRQEQGAEFTVSLPIYMPNQQLNSNKIKEPNQ